MKPKKITFLLLVLTLVFASTAFDCGVKELNKNYKTDDPFARSKEILKKYPQTNDRIIKIYRDPSTVKIKTPKGANVWLEPNVTAESWELQKIDEGMERTFAKAKCRNLNSVLANHNSWTVAFLDSVVSPIDKIPSLQIPYFGGVTGIEGNPETITAAGQFVFMRDDVVGGANVIALPDHKDQAKPEALSNGAEYELEHGILADADTETYLATRYHQTGGHPLIADCP